MFKYPHILSCLPCSRCRVISRTFYKPATTLKPKPRGRGISVDTWSTFARLRLRKWLRVYEVCCSVLSTFLGHIKCNFQMQHLSVKALKEKSHLYLLCMLLLPKTLKSIGIHISNVIMLFMVKTKLVLFKSDTTMKCWINDLSLDKNARWWISQLVLMTVFAVTEFLLELLSAYFTLLSNKS